MRKQNLYFIEETDTFCGEANYSYVERYIVKASTTRGALRKVASKGWRMVHDGRADSASGLTCWLVYWISSDDADRLVDEYSSIYDERSLSTRRARCKN